MKQFSGKTENLQICKNYSPRKRHPTATHYITNLTCIIQYSKLIPGYPYCSLTR